MKCRFVVCESDQTSSHVWVVGLVLTEVNKFHRSTSVLVQKQTSFATDRSKPKPKPKPKPMQIPMPMPIPNSNTKPNPCQINAKMPFSSRWQKIEFWNLPTPHLPREHCRHMNADRLWPTLSWPKTRHSRSSGHVINKTFLVAKCTTAIYYAWFLVVVSFAKVMPFMVLVTHHTLQIHFTCN